MPNRTARMIDRTQLRPRPRAGGRAVLVVMLLTLLLVAVDFAIALI